MQAFSSWAVIFTLYLIRKTLGQATPIQVLVGGNANFNFQLNSDPQREVVYIRKENGLIVMLLRGTNAIYTTDRVEFTGNTNVRQISFILRNVTLEDAGNYTATVSIGANVLGKQTLLVFTSQSRIISIQSNKNTTEAGESLILSCLVNDSANDNGIAWFTPGKQGVFGMCYRQSGFCTGGLSSHTFTTNITGSYLYIASLNRSQDEGIWRCMYMNSSGYQDEVAILITVYTLPSALIYTNSPTTDTDLGVSFISLQCRTSGCAYPAPFIHWYYTDKNNSNARRLYTTTNTTGNFDTCIQPEKVYTSSFDIPRFTTWLNNSGDKTVTLSCGIEYSDFSKNIFSPESKSVHFAVRVTEVNLHHNNQPVSDAILTVSEGQITTLTCISILSRPPAIIEWYLGTRKVENGTRLSLTASNEDHEKEIYCRAYNIDPNMTVESTKPRLYVQVPVKTVHLLDDNHTMNDAILEVTPEVPKTLQCAANVDTRPPASFLWYLDAQLKGTTSSLTFTPTTDDHEKEIYCKAYSSDIEKALSSIQLRLQIKGIPLKPTQFHVKHSMGNGVILTWTPSPVDSFKQTFVIEGTRVNSEDKWINMSIVQDEYCSSVAIVDNLRSENIYMFRIYAYTSSGRGKYADDIVNITIAGGRCTFECVQENIQQAPEAGAVIGGTIGGVVFGVVLTALFFILRRNDKCLYSTCLQRSGKESATEIQMTDKNIKQEEFTYQNVGEERMESDQSAGQQTIMRSGDDSIYTELTEDRKSQHNYDKLDVKC